ncbi:MAG: ATP-binding protein [Myxococcales bacterium]|nr:ATP-binding protein [Myxococcales bacterium]
MMHEPPINSADELVHLLESWLRHLGLLWLISYLRGPFHDPRLDRLLFDMLRENDRDLSVGSWAYLGSQIFHTFRRHRWKAPWPTLHAFDYGDPRDATSRLSRMLRYRNSFAHGSFDAVLQDILEHRRCLWEMIKAFETLADAPLLFWEPTREGWFRVDLELSPWEGEIPSDIQKSAVYWRLEEGHWIEVSPFFQVEAQEKPMLYASHAFHLVPLYLSRFSLEERERMLSIHPRVAVHLQRSHRMRMGFLDEEKMWEGENLESLGDQRESLCTGIGAALEEHHADKPTFVLVLAYPGSGKSSLVAYAPTLFPRFDGVIRYKVDRHEPSASGRTFARYLLRKLAGLLHDDSWLEGIEGRSPETRLHEAFQVFASQGKTLLVCIDRFHFGYESSPQEPLCLYDLLAGLQGEWASSLSFLLAARIGYRDDLLYDTVFHLPPTEYEKRDAYPRLLGELGLQVDDPDSPLVVEEIIFRRHILRLLSSSDAALSSFAICEHLHQEADQGVYPWTPEQRFSPHVERVLWEMRPISQCDVVVEGELEERRYKPFCQSFSRYIEQSIPWGGR